MGPESFSKPEANLEIRVEIHDLKRKRRKLERADLKESPWKESES